MRPSSSARDTLITFQQRARVQDPTYGTWTDGEWADLPSNPQEMAEVRDILPSRSESVANGVSIQRRPCRVRCLYRDDITSDMRVLIGDRVLQIVAGPAEMGRRDGLEMVCEEVSTEGEAP